MRSSWTRTTLRRGPISVFSTSPLTNRKTRWLLTNMLSERGYLRHRQIPNFGRTCRRGSSISRPSWQTCPRSLHRHRPPPPQGERNLFLRLRRRGTCPSAATCPTNSKPTVAGRKIPKWGHQAPTLTPNSRPKCPSPAFISTHSSFRRCSTCNNNPIFYLSNNSCCTSCSHSCV